MDYKPAPRDTSSIALPRAILDLTELLAKNAHENWARQRMAEGWRYGPKRDDARKEHPSLVPYEELSESEKEYDRKTAMEAVKTIVGLGYRIESPQPPAASSEEIGAPRDEMHDSPAERAAPYPLGPYLELCEKELRGFFDEVDEEAKARREGYRRLTGRAAFLGLLALLVAAAQLTFEEALKEYKVFLAWIEGLLLAIGAGHVLYGLLTYRREEWLLKRIQAEESRLLKFGSLIDPTLWISPEEEPAKSHERFRLRVKAIRRLSHEDLDALAQREEVRNIPAGSDCGRVNREALERLLLPYYRERRLNTQIAYFGEKINGTLWQRLDNPRLVPLFFFASAGLILIHLLFQAVWLEEQDGLLKWIVFGSLAVPAAWTAIRTQRTAHEFARNAVRSRARHFALCLISERLLEEKDLVRIFGYLYLCEFILAADQREWLRLMKEAEWYG